LFAGAGATVTRDALETIAAADLLASRVFTESGTDGDGRPAG
jgi:hypothetical protein